VKLLGKILIEFYKRIIVKTSDRYVIWKAMLDKNKIPSAIDLPSHHVNVNRLIWDNYDWSKGGGDEWTLDVKENKKIDPIQWKNLLISSMMLKYIKRNSDIMEIGVGAGRWTEFLQSLAKKLILVDISEKCLDICRRKFKNFDNVEYNLVTSRLDMIKDNGVDYIWSYDVFVHLNPTDIERYIEDFSRILKPGGHAIIHHSGLYSEDNIREKNFRTYMNGPMFAHIVKKNGMIMIEQNDSIAHLPGDIVSVFFKS
jgi:ubiquinone/menaquinone biosynthesis C-methylase UbiE